MYLDEVLYPAYVRNGFGKINRSEIDLYVFHGFLLKELDECYLQRDESHQEKKVQIKYLELDKQILYNLASKANISIARFSTLLENDYNVFCNGTALDYKAQLHKIIQNKRFELNFEKKKTIRISVVNPILRQLLIKEINLQDGTPDFSFNKDILDIEFVDFLQLLDATDSFYEHFRDKLENQNKIDSNESKELSNVQRLKKVLANASSRLVPQIISFLLEFAIQYVTSSLIS